MTATTDGSRSWTGRHWRTGQPVTVTASGGRITEICESATDTEEWLAPGLIDLQVNGIAGFDVNRGEPAPETVVGATKALLAEGVVRFCPVVGTASEDHMTGALRSIATACQIDPQVAHAVAGIHVEGPFISEQDGPRGVHDPSQVRDPDWAEFERWQEAAGGRIRIVTLAPERVGSLEFIRRLRAEGIIASIGHTAASPTQIAAAVDAGASMSTHLGNGAHAKLARHPNYIWAQLADDRLWAGLIGDGFHIEAAPLTVMLRAKGDRAVLVSDVTSLAQMPPGRYSGQHHTDVVLEPSGRLHIADSPQLLAGSASSLLAGLGFVVRSGIVSLAEAITLASTRPATVIGVAGDGAGELRPGGACDLIRMTWDGEHATVRETVVLGETVYLG